MRNLLAILSIFLIFSCKPLQNVTVKGEKVRVDTLIIEKISKVLPAVHDTLIIDNPCDSSGILTTFYSKIKIPQGQVIIRSVRGKIQATVNIDSIAQVYDNKYRSIVKSDVTNFQKIVTKNVIPKWAIWVMAIGAIFTFLYLRNFIIKFTT